MNEQLKKRFTNVIFVAALSGFAYQILQNLGVTIDQGLWKQGVDLLSFVLIGTGIYSSFEEKGE